MGNAKPDTAIVEKAATHVRGTIKPLVWEVITTDNDLKSGHYNIDYMGENWGGRDKCYLHLKGDYLSKHPTLEAAKSAAQADFEARILAQIDPAPEMQPVARSDEAGAHPDAALQQIIFLAREARPAGVQRALERIEKIAVSALPAAREEVSVAEADQAKARVFSRREDYNAGFNAALRSGRAGASADLLLAAYDTFMRGEPISPEQKELSDRVARAACYGAAAFTSGKGDDQGTHAMARSFLLALTDPLHEELDYLRADPATGKAVRERRTALERKDGSDV